MNVQIKDEEVHRVLSETNKKRPACMKEVCEQQNAKRQKKVGTFYIILFFTLILLLVLRVTMPIVVVLCGVVSNLFF
jgi:Flp pilus assembly protein TadB